MYHVGETVTPPTDRERPRGPCRFPPAELSNDRLRAIPEKIRSFRNAPQPAWQGLVTVAARSGTVWRACGSSAACPSGARILTNAATSLPAGPPKCTPFGDGGRGGLPTVNTVW